MLFPFYKFTTTLDLDEVPRSYAPRRYNILGAYFYF